LGCGHRGFEPYLLGGLGSSMLIEIGHVEAIFRYPVKSMGGERLEVAKLGWHGLDGDRRLAFRPIDLLRSAAKTVLRETFRRIFARRKAKRCLSSGRTWPRRSDVGTGLPCR